MKKVAFLLLFVSFVHCSGRFVKREELQYFEEKYSGVYIMKQKVDAGNNQYVAQGSRVRLYFRADSDSVKVYAYPHNQTREMAMGKNILLLFAEDFPDEKYNREIFENKLNELIVPVN